MLIFLVIVDAPESTTTKDEELNPWKSQAQTNGTRHVPPD